MTTLDERYKCPSCGSIRLKTIKGDPDYIRIKVRNCEDETCENNGQELWRTIK